MTVAAASAPNPAAPAVGAIPPSPYRGLRPYTEAEADFFFGREAEVEIVSANLLAARLTLLYGPSGVGKSSVLLAGVVNSLRRRSRENVADEDAAGFAAVVVRSWGDPDPRNTIAAAARAEVAALLERDDLPDPADDATLAQVLEHWSAQVGGKLLLVFDQFEEYFLYHDRDSGPGTFDAELPQAVNRPDLPANFLVSIRDDGLARLDRFKGRIPHLFDNRLQIDHLTVDAARDAMRLPLKEYNRRVPEGERVDIEEKLVEAVLAQVRTGQVSLQSSGAGAVRDAAEADARVETPILQVVVTALWEKEAELGSRTLRAKTFTDLGGAEQIVRDRLDERMKRLDPAERDIAAEIVRFLVTPSGTKIAYTAADLTAVAYPKPDLAEWAGPRVESVVAKLADGDTRILRPIAPPAGQGPTRFEIFHDVLGPAILDWRARHLKDRELADAVKIGVAGGLLVFTGFWWLFWTLIVVVAAISDNAWIWLALLWTLSALGLLVAWARVLRRRWLRRQPRLVLGTALAAVSILTYPLSVVVIVPVGFVLRRRRKRAARTAAVADGPAEAAPRTQTA
jgi:hypothetical protein